MSRKNYAKKIGDNAEVSPDCGENRKDGPAEQEKEQEKEQAADKETGHKAGWGILSFFFPVVGLILFLKWKANRRKTASVCGKCAIAGAVLGFLLAFFLLALT